MLTLMVQDKAFGQELSSNALTTEAEEPENQLSPLASFSGRQIEALPPDFGQSPVSSQRQAAFLISCCTREKLQR